ncbi:MAG TPA: protealysin inhibitor emfourin [Casimicrobiaceae bacterium]|nr:protealysin inhibitor emfourin [Casimicrobiaceae bacterium]
MRIAFSVDGGVASFPGLRRPVTLECDRLPPERSARLKALVEEAHFFSAAPAPPSPAARDVRSYTVEVDDGARCRTLTLTEPIADAALRALVEELRVCARMPST